MDMPRRLTGPDAAAFRDLRLEALAQAPTAFGSALADEINQPLDWFAARLGAGAVFGAGAPLLGMAGFRRETSVKRRHIGWLWGVYLRPAARGTGLARALAQTVIDHARVEVDWLRLEVVTTNAPAIALYRSLGFTIHGTEPASLRLDGVDHDEHLMSLDLRSTR